MYVRTTKIWGKKIYVGNIYFFATYIFFRVVFLKIVENMFFDHFLTQKAIFDPKIMFGTKSHFLIKTVIFQPEKSQKELKMTIFRSNDEFFAQKWLFWLNMISRGQKCCLGPKNGQKQGFVHFQKYRRKKIYVEKKYMFEHIFFYTRFNIYPHSKR